MTSRRAMSGIPRPRHRTELQSSNDKSLGPRRKLTRHLLQATEAAELVARRTAAVRGSFASNLGCGRARRAGQPVGSPGSPGLLRAWPGSSAFAARVGTRVTGKRFGGAIAVEP